MKEQGFKRLPIIGVLFCVLLAGCDVAAEDQSLNDSGESIVLEETQQEADGLSAQQSVQPSVDSMFQEEPLEEAECGTVGGENVAGTQWPADFEIVKEKLSALPVSGEELKKLAGTENCPVPVYEISLTNNYEGEYVVEPEGNFRSLLEAGEAAEMLLLRYTVEGDLILDYLNFDGEKLFRINDCSRDKWGGDAERYTGYVYDSVWFTDRTDELGNTWETLYGLCDGDMVMEIMDWHWK